jgi:hypothetical protein
MRNIFYLAPFFLCCYTWRASAQRTASDTLPKIRELKEVVVESRPPLRMKGDTIEYNAAQFKTKQNAVVEDLLKKLPGVKVDKGGNITAQGETVRKVLVDGKEFFGNDPSIATKNLPADMVDKIQVLDKMSDQGEFSGIDDGDKTKTINIVTKKDRKKGYFGNLSAGGGPDGKYEGGININSFAGDQQLSLLFKANNINKSGFSASELLRMVSANPELFNNLPSFAIAELSRMKGVRINTDDPAEKAELARPIGLNNTQYGGLNYNNDWNEALKLRSSYFYNRFTTRNRYAYNRQYRLPDTAYNYLQNGRNWQENNNHQFNASTDIKLDDQHSLKLSPFLTRNSSRNNSSRSYSSYSADNKQRLNEGVQQMQGTNTTTNAGADILYRHRFDKPGRTLSITASPAWFDMDNNSLNIARNTYYNTGPAIAGDSVDQQTNSISNTFSLNNNIVYTERLSPHLALKLNAQVYYSEGDYRQLAYNFDQGTKEYTVKDDRYSDIYTSTAFKILGDLSLAGSYRRFNYTAGMGLEQSRLDGNSDYKGYKVRGRYNTLLPHAYAKYRFSRTESLSLYYKTSAALPGLAQLRPLEDISDPLYTRKGAPDLRQSVQHQLTLAYLTSNIYHNTFTNIQLRLSKVHNQITDFYSTDNSGKQLITPVNASGNFSGSLHGEHSFPLGGNGSALTLGAEIAYNKYPGYFNAVADKISQWTLTPDLSFNYYPADFLNITLRGNTAWNSRRSAASPAADQQYWFLDYGLGLIATLPWKMSADAGIDCYTTTGLSSAYNNTVTLLNAGLTKDIGRKYALRLEAQDLLNRNRSFSRLARNGYTEDRRNEVLGRYFMLSLIYKLRHFAKNNSSL